MQAAQGTGLELLVPLSLRRSRPETPAVRGLSPPCHCAEGYRCSVRGSHQSECLETDLVVRGQTPRRAWLGPGRWGESHRELAPSPIHRDGRRPLSWTRCRPCLQPWRPPPAAFPLPTCVPASPPGSLGPMGAQPRLCRWAGSPHAGGRPGRGDSLSEPRAPHLRQDGRPTPGSPWVPTLGGSSSDCHLLTAQLFRQKQGRRVGGNGVFWSLQGPARPRLQGQHIPRASQGAAASRLGSVPGVTPMDPREAPGGLRRPLPSPPPGGAAGPLPGKPGNWRFSPRPGLLLCSGVFQSFPQEPAPGHLAGH